MKCINRCLSLRNSQVVSNSPSAIEAAIREACAVADIVVLNAGSSKGSGDWACEVMESIGTMICHQTNHGPGHHSSYAMVDGVPIVGISGPSAGAAVTLGFYLRPLIRAALSLNPAPIAVKATLVEEMPALAAAALLIFNLRKKRSLLGRTVPPEATGPTDVFFGLKPMSLLVSAEGRLEVRPVRGHWGTPAANAANALFMMPSGGGAVPVQIGDLLEVEIIGPVY